MLLNVTNLSSITILLTDMLDDYRLPGAIYVPAGQTVSLTYTGAVALSLKSGALRRFQDQGYVSTALRFEDGLDWDQAPLEFGPANYTPNLTPDTTSIDQISAHLKGIDDALVIGAGFPSGAIIVAKSGGQFNTIAGGLGAAASGKVVLVYPGDYPESGLVIPPGVRLAGYPATENVIISGADATSTRVTMSPGSTLRDLKVVAPSSGSSPAVDATGLAGQIGIVSGLVLQGAGGSGPFLEGPGTGFLDMRDIRQDGGVVNGPALRFSGGGEVILQEMMFEGGSSTTSVEVADAHLEIHTIIWSEDYVSTNGLYLTDASSKVQAVALMFPDFEVSQITNALRVGADGIKFSSDASHVHGKVGGYDLLVDGGLVGTGTEFTLSGETRYERVQTPLGWSSAGVILGVTIDDGIQNNPAIRVNGDMAVGVPDNPSESSFGTGDEVVAKSVWLFDSSLGTYTDVTPLAQSSSGSTFTMLGDAGDQLLVGYDLPFASVFANLTQAAIPTPALIAQQIWTGASWENIRVMSSDADEPYSQHGDTSFANSLREQVRLDFEGDADPESASFGEPISLWAPSDPMLSGTPYYYMAYTVQGGSLGTPPIFQRVMVGFSRSKVSGTGFGEAFGAAEGQRKTLEGTPRQSFTGGGAPSTSTFNLSSGVEVSVPLSRLNVGDGFQRTFNLLRGSDTSREFRYTVEWIVPSANTGTVEYTVLVSLIRGSVDLDSGTLPEIPVVKTVTVDGTNNNNRRITTDLYFDLTEGVDGDEISVSISRSGGTLVGSVQIWKTDFYAVKWTSF